jgi:HAD superfamily hydrolase (TIGR01509 family)
VLFDVDGTLVDTNYLHTLAWSRAIADAGEWAPMNAIHRLVGMGGDRLIPALLGHDCPKAASSRATRYRELMGEARPFPGASAIVRAVHDSGVATVLATSSPADELDDLLELLCLDDALDGKITADDVPSSKPSPDVLFTAMERAGLDSRRTVAVGDSVWDVEAARSAGIACVGVESGGFSRYELGEAGAVAVYRDVAELLEQFHTSPLAPLQG